MGCFFMSISMQGCFFFNVNKHAYMSIITHGSFKMSHIGPLIKKILFFSESNNVKSVCIQSKKPVQSSHPSTFVHRLRCSARLAEPRRGSNGVFDKTGGGGRREGLLPCRWRVNETTFQDERVVPVCSSAAVLSPMSKNSCILGRTPAK